MTLDARLDEQTLHELYLAPFEAIVRNGGAWSVMAAYNAVNGERMTESPLLRDVLHDEWDYNRARPCPTGSQPGQRQHLPMRRLTW